MAPYTRLRKRIDEDPKKKSSSSSSMVGHHGSTSSPSSDKRRRKTFNVLTEEQAKRYAQQVKESEGFDVEDFGCDVVSFNRIVPIDGEIEQDRELKKCSNRALKHFKDNVDKNAKLKFVRVVKANSRGGPYWNYYITFEAKDAAADDKVKIFQALVTVNYVDGATIHVKFCRQKPPTYP